MNGRARVGSLAASPTMVGAITTLIVLVAVFLAYNANNGLPFVPTYKVSAEICDAARLGPNNEVRIGGNRVGAVESIDTVPAPPNSGCQAADGSSRFDGGKLNLKLDKSAEPLPADSTIRVRYRSSFGLKYLEITPWRQRNRGASRRDHPRSPSRSSRSSSTTSTTPSIPRPDENSRAAGPAGIRRCLRRPRRASLNEAIGALDPLFATCGPILAKALADPTTQLVRFFPELARRRPDRRSRSPSTTPTNSPNGAIAFGAISPNPAGSAGHDLRWAAGPGSRAAVAACAASLPR